MHAVDHKTINLALGKVAKQSSLSEWSSPAEAGGAVNGRKNGHFSFHTAREFRPWWQVDLGSICSLDRILVYNRTDECSERAYDLEVLVGDTIRDLYLIHKQRGRPFGGVDGRPLEIDPSEKTARFVRIQLRGFEALHLDEVEIYGREVP